MTREDVTRWAENPSWAIHIRLFADVCRDWLRQADRIAELERTSVQEAHTNELADYREMELAFRQTVPERFRSHGSMSRIIAAMVVHIAELESQLRDSEKADDDMQVAVEHRDKKIEKLEAEAKRHRMIPRSFVAKCPVCESDTCRACGATLAIEMQL